MYGQILTHKNEDTTKILGVCGEIIFVSTVNDHKEACDTNFTKQELIDRGWIFPVEKWTPSPEEKYYVPSVTSKDKYGSVSWINDEHDKNFLANNLVCRTPEEAIALTDKMLGAVSN